jgi:putative redox protein
MAKPITTTLTWSGDLRFAAESGVVSTTLDSRGQAGLSPMQSLLMSLAGCMAIDVVDILQKGRHPLAGLEASLSGDRAEQPPRRYTRITLHFTIRGDVPAHAVERAIQLSRDTYCSVWQSMRQDIAFETSFDIVP